jgi:hypothetical protein
MLGKVHTVPGFDRIGQLKVISEKTMIPISKLLRKAVKGIIKEYS